MSDNGPAPERAICRDCLYLQAGRGDGALRCQICGSPRLLAQAERRDLRIAHIDCDAFYASIEKRDDPELADRPVIVGGGLRRGVVSTCCYIARIRGVRSAMPMAQALKLCPEARVLPPDMAKYALVAKALREMMQRLTPLVEPISIDEAFLDLTGCEGANGAGPVIALARFAGAVERQLGVTVSVGLSDCKFLAKLASDRDKPRGFSIIDRAEALGILAPLSIGRIWGVGKVAQARLENSGFATIGDLQKLKESAALARLGAEGGRLWRLARGIDLRRVGVERETKSISAEITFDDDSADIERLEGALTSLCDRVAKRLKKQALAAKSVTLKLRTGDFRLRTRTRSGLRPTQLAPRLFAVARELLGAEAKGAAFRLIGVGAHEFAPASEADLADLIDDVSREKAREGAIDALREKFGAQAIIRGRAFRRG